MHDSAVPACLFKVGAVDCKVGLPAPVLHVSLGGVLLAQVREGRPQKSKVIRGNNNPEFHEDFFLVVDNLETQTLTIKVYDQDLLMPEDELLGIRKLCFSEEKIVVDEVTGEEKVREMGMGTWSVRACR